MPMVIDEHLILKVWLGYDNGRSNVLMLIREKQYPNEIINNPHIHRPITEIYETIDNWTWEKTPEEWPNMLQNNSYFLLSEIILPPLKYENRFIKGIMLTQFADFMQHSLYPQIRELFHIISSSGYCGYSWQENVDALACSYDNPERIAWFKTRYPNRSHLLHLTTGEEDWTNEMFFTPRVHMEKSYDLITINRILVDFKCPNFFASILKTYEKKYGYRLRVLMPLDLNDIHSETPYCWGIKERFQDFCNQFDNVHDYVHMVQLISDVPHFYTQCKMYVLTSLLEGKNRSLYEAQACDIPVVCAEEFNQYARGGLPCFPENSGLYAKFDPESFADRIHTVLTNLEDFTPRKNFLNGFSGRKWFLNTAINQIPYYQKHLPDYKADHHYDNPWLDLAMHYNYELSLHDFIYSGGIPYHRYSSQWDWHLGSLLKFYLIRFGYNLR